MAELLGDVVQVLDARAYIEGLPAPEALPQDGLAHHHGIIGKDEGPHRQAVDGRGGDQAHFPHPGQGQLQGPGNGRGGQGQHVHIRLQGLQALLVGDAEVLFLVHHQKAEITEVDGLGQQSVSADHNIHGTTRQTVLDQLGILGRHQAG